MKRKQVICICGPQGSGKTLYAQNRFGDSEHFSTLEEIKPRERRFIPDKHLVLISTEETTLKNFCKRHDLIITETVKLPKIKYIK